MARRQMSKGLKTGLKVAGAVAGAGLLAYGAYKGYKALKGRASKKGKRSQEARLKKKIRVNTLKLQNIKVERKLFRESTRL